MKKRTILLTVAVLLVAIVVIAWKILSAGAPANPLVITSSPQAGEFDHSHAQFTKVLRASVKDEFVDYQLVKSDPAELSAYLGSLAAADEATFSAWTKDQQLAFLINLYNAATIAMVAQEYPIASIKDIGNFFKGPWDQPVVPLFGKFVTLNHVEHQLIRKNYDEPRAHFGLVCASIGCPPLREEAFVADRLGEQMDEQGKIFFATKSKNRLDTEAGILHLSPIFKWFTEDFTSKAGSVEKFAAPYFPESGRELILSGKLKIEHTSYDWSLNEQKK